MQRVRSSPWQVLSVFLQLGVTSFGGPIAHLGYFRREFVQRRGWVDDAVYAELVALCQFLPGPASSQVGIAIGLLRAGRLGALAAWLGFTLPSALLLLAFAGGLSALAFPTHAAWLRGLLIAAVAVVAQAVWSMAWRFCRGPWLLVIAAVAACLCLSFHGGATQLAVLAAAGLIGWWLLPAPQVSSPPPATIELPLSRAQGLRALALFAALLAVLPLAAELTHAHALALFDRFYRTGSLVFGGGHVVLPLLRAQVVPPGWISDPLFMAGYAAAQAVPGPLFSFASYLGATMTPSPRGVVGAAICLSAIYLPSFLLVLGVMPFWTALRHQSGARAALMAVNAAVVGVLLSALYDPVITSAIHGVGDAVIAVAGLALLQWLKLPSWAVLVLCTLAACL